MEHNYRVLHDAFAVLLNNWGAQLLMCLYWNNFIIQTSSAIDWVCVWLYFMNEYLWLLTKMVFRSLTTLWGHFCCGWKHFLVLIQQHIWGTAAHLGLWSSSPSWNVHLHASFCVSGSSSALTWEEKNQNQICAGLNRFNIYGCECE